MYIIDVDKFQDSSKITFLKSKLSFEHNYWFFFVRFSFNDVYLEALPLLGRTWILSISIWNGECPVKRLDLFKIDLW